MTSLSLLAGRTVVSLLPFRATMTPLSSGWGLNVELYMKMATLLGYTCPHNIDNMGTTAYRVSFVM